MYAIPNGGQDTDIFIGIKQYEHGTEDADDRIESDELTVFAAEAAKAKGDQKNDEADEKGVTGTRCQGTEPKAGGRAEGDE